MKFLEEINEDFDDLVFQKRMDGEFALQFMLIAELKELNSNLSVLGIDIKDKWGLV